ncbi:MAG: type II secretion system F family protein [Planctomycetota bacterium]|jgi:type II secretory pathway component PulF
MLFSARISTSQLAGLCRRLAESLAAGIDVRTVWAREADRARGSGRASLRLISDAIDRGESMRDALAYTDDYFPPLFRELADVGEQTGHLAESFAQLAEHYEFQIKLTRKFLVSITWPLIELAIAVVVIGLLIYVMGLIGQSRGVYFDVLGLGLDPGSSLLVYVAFVTAVALAVAFVIFAIRRGVVWTRPIQRLVIRLPMLGTALNSLALARLSWSLHVTLSTGMDIRRAVLLSVRSARNARYTDGLKSIGRAIAAGDSVYEAFHATGVYPVDFLDAIQVGEQAGNLDDATARLAEQYRDRAEAAMDRLGTFGFFLVFGVIACIIIYMIFRVASIYLGSINEALDMVR